MTQPQREWFEKDYYKALGLSETATEAEISKAYRKLAKENHPDSHPGREERFKEISAAYAVLSDTEKRTSYDEVRRLGPSAYAGGPAGGYGAADLGDLFGTLFGQSRQGGRARSGATRMPRRGDDLETSLTLSFADSVAGVTTTVTVVGSGPCSQCLGTGAAPGTTPQPCGVCGGRGTIDQNQGFFSFSQPCATCAGSGVRIEHPCDKCKGSGTDRVGRTINVRVPAGVEDGQRIRLKGKGSPGENGGPPGDLFVVVRVETHALFARRGKDLTISVPVTFAEAALGATISVPTMDEPVSLRVPPGSRHGRTLRVKGRGSKTAGGHGDLLVTLEVAIPTTLDESQRAALEAYAALVGDGAALRSALGA